MDDIDFVEDYERHRGAFEYAWNVMADTKYANHFMKINTSIWERPNIIFLFKNSCNCPGFICFNKLFLK